MKRTATILGTILIVLAVLALFATRILQDPAPDIDVVHRDRAIEAVASQSLADLLWYVIAGLAIGAAAVTAFARNVVHAGLALLGSFGAVAVMFIYLSADFVAVTQVAVYIGGIMVLILFAVMLTNKIEDVELSNPSVGLHIAGGLGAALVGLLGFIAVKMPWNVIEPGPVTSTVNNLGNAFLQEYLLPFEVASVLLLAVVIGAVIIVRKEVRPEAE